MDGGAWIIICILIFIGLAAATSAFCWFKCKRKCPDCDCPKCPDHQCPECPECNCPKCPECEKCPKCPECPKYEEQKMLKWHIIGYASKDLEFKNPGGPRTPYILLKATENGDDWYSIVSLLKKEQPWWVLPRENIKDGERVSARQYGPPVPATEFTIRTNFQR